MVPTKVRLVLTSLVTLLVSWILLQKHRYRHQVDLELRNVQLPAIWDLFSNHHNFMKLNPTILSYSLLSAASKVEIGEGERDEGWDGTEPTIEFKVTYQEHLVYLPFITHEAEGTYRIYSRNQPKGEPFRIISEHRTEVLGTSLETTEVTRILHQVDRKNGGDAEETTTRILSTVEYDCQFLLAKYCEMEFRGQRALIHANLKRLTESLPSSTIIP